MLLPELILASRTNAISHQLVVILQVFAIEQVTFAVDFVPMVLELSALVVEFISFAVKLVLIAHGNGIRCLCNRIRSI